MHPTFSGRVFRFWTCRELSKEIFVLFFVTLFNGTIIFVFLNDVFIMALYNIDRIPSGSLLKGVILLAQFLLETMLKIGTVKTFLLKE